ncbi:MAG: hypothetical protein JKX76_02960 [Colwellia sp.]|nr:hypothetical protein [Colwellia sp.]
MTTKHVYLHTFEVSRQGEKLLFQIKLPKNARRIIGIDFTVNTGVGTSEGRNRKQPIFMPGQLNQK